MQHKIDDLVTQIFALERLAYDRIHCNLKRSIKAIHLRMRRLTDDAVPECLAMHARVVELQKHAIARRQKIS